MAKATKKDALEALKGMMEAYAPNAEKTVEKEGAAALHSAVRRARAVLKDHGIVIKPWQP